MQFKNMCYAVGIAIFIVSVASLPTATPINLGSFAHLRNRELEGVSARSPDVVPGEECKRALHTESVSDESVYRRCAGGGEGEEESGLDGDTEEGGDDDTGGTHDNDGDIDTAQIASNSPRQDCILTQMELFPMPNFGICESLPETPPTPDPVPPVTPAPDPITPQRQPEPAPAPASAPPPSSAHKPVPADAGGPARAIPKRVIKDRDLERKRIRDCNSMQSIELVASR